MKICVINASPRTHYSITLHTSLYLQKLFPQHEFAFAEVGRKIHYSTEETDTVIQKMLHADLLLFSYPVYTFIAPSQLHFFIRRLKEMGVDLSGKYATQITTSKHFYDVTAHRYVEENCRDLGMKFIRGLSADMEDLTTEKGRKEAEEFFRYAIYCVENNIYETIPEKKQENAFVYTPAMEKTEQLQNKEIALVCDLAKDDAALQAMIEDFVRSAPYKVKTVNIAEYPFQGGCLGCFHCAADGKCIYKDRFDSFLRDSIQSADATIYAFTIVDHSMGPRFKLFDDRQFCNGHRTVTEGEPVGYLVNGTLGSETNLQMILEARSEVGHNFLAGVASDAESMRKMNMRLAYAMEHAYVQPRNFFGVGGMKIFRDLIWLMRGLMKADHDFYKAKGVYDFPQKQRGKMMLMCLLGSAMRNPKLKAKMGKKFDEGMVAPYRKVLQNTKPIE